MLSLRRVNIQLTGDMVMYEALPFLLIIAFVVFLGAIFLAVKYRMDLSALEDRLEFEKKSAAGLEERVRKMSGYLDELGAELDTARDRYTRAEQNVQKIKEDFEKQLRNERQHMSVVMDEVKEKYRKAIDDARKDAAKRSRAVVKGKNMEQVATVTGGWPYTARDCRFMGDPIDFIVFNGYSDVRDGTSNTIEEIVFIELKTTPRTPRLSSKTQKAIRDAIKAGRVRFSLMKVNPTSDGSAFEIVEDVVPGVESIKV